MNWLERTSFAFILSFVFFSTSGFTAQKSVYDILMDEGLNDGANHSTILHEDITKNINERIPDVFSKLKEISSINAEAVDEEGFIVLSLVSYQSGGQSTQFISIHTSPTGVGYVKAWRAASVQEKIVSFNSVEFYKFCKKIFDESKNPIR